MKIVYLVLITVGIIGIIVILMRVPSSSTSNNTNSIDSRIERLDVNQFNSELTNQNAVILDIRTAGEYSTGYIPNSKNIDFYAYDFKEQLDKLDKDVEYKIYCNSGNRSGETLNMMRSLGFKNVVDLKGGITAWRSASLDICTNC